VKDKGTARDVFAGKYLTENDVVVAGDPVSSENRAALTEF
jgi:hypothetical protein